MLCSGRDELLSAQLLPPGCAGPVRGGSATHQSCHLLPGSIQDASDLGNNEQGAAPGGVPAATHPPTTSVPGRGVSWGT